MPVQGGTRHRPAKGTVTAQPSAQPWLLPSPSPCLSHEVTLAPGLSRVPVICPCRNRAPRCTSLINNNSNQAAHQLRQGWPRHEAEIPGESSKLGGNPRDLHQGGVRHSQDRSGHRGQPPLGDRHPAMRLPFLLWRMENTKNVVRKRVTLLRAHASPSTTRQHRLSSSSSPTRTIWFPPPPPPP